MAEEGSTKVITAEKPEDLSQEDMARLIVDMFHRNMVHYTLWFTAVKHQFGITRALEIMKKARKNSYDIQMDRMAKVFGFEMVNGIPSRSWKCRKKNSSIS